MGGMPWPHTPGIEGIPWLYTPSFEGIPWPYMPSVEGIPWSLDTMITPPLVGDEEQTCSRRLTRVVADAW